jgi:flagellar protein FlgJ
MVNINSIAANNGYIPLAGRSEAASEARSGFSQILEKAKTMAETDRGEPKKSESHIIDRRNFDAEQQKLYETCEALETFIVKNMLSGMRKTVTKSNLIDTGFAGEMYEDMLWDEYAKEYTKKADFGLAEQAYLELTNQRGSRLIG